MPFIDVARRVREKEASEKAKATEAKEPPRPEPSELGPRGEQLRQKLHAKLAGVVPELGPRGEIAAKVAEGIAARAANLSPMDIARTKLVKAVRKATDLFKRGELKKEAAQKLVAEKEAKTIAEQHAEAIRLADIYRAEEEEAIVRREGKIAGKPADAIAKEDENTIREKAYAAEKKAAKGEKVNPLRLKMAEHFHDLKPLRTKKDAASLAARDLYWSQIRQLHKKLVAEQRVVDKAKRQEEIAAERQARADDKYVKAALAEAVKAGLIDQERADIITGSAVGAGKAYRTKIARARKSTPTLARVIRANPMPELGRTAIKKQVIAGSPVKAMANADIRKWGEQIVKAAEAAGVTLPTKRNQFFNTPEENALSFIKAMTTGKFSLAAKAENYAMNFNDVWYLGQLLEERAPAAAPTRREQNRAMDLHNNEDQINGTLFDAGKTNWSGVELGKARLPRAERRKREETASRSHPAGARPPPVRAVVGAGARRSQGPTTQLQAGSANWRRGRGCREARLATSLPRTRTVVVGEGQPERPAAGQGLPDDDGGAGDRPPRHQLQGDGRRAAVAALDTPLHHQAYARADRRHARALRRRLGDRRRSTRVNSAPAATCGKEGIILMHEGVRGAPKQMANVLFHELTHAATAYALKNNLRGTRDVTQALMDALRKQLGSLATLDEAGRHAMSKPEEFITAGLENAPFQEMLASLRPDVKTRAMVRALGKGRAMPTYWDLFVSAVQNAIGAFTPGRAGHSLPRPGVEDLPACGDEQSRTDGRRAGAGRARHGRWRQRRAAVPVRPGQRQAACRPGARFAQRPGQFPQEAYRHYGEPLENKNARVAEDVFGGSFDNPFNDAVRSYTSKRRLVEDEMQPIMQTGTTISRWMRQDLATRNPQVGHAHATMLRRIARWRRPAHSVRPEHLGLARRAAPDQEAAPDPDGTARAERPTSRRLGRARPSGTRSPTSSSRWCRNGPTR